MTDWNPFDGMSDAELNDFLVVIGRMLNEQYPSLVEEDQRLMNWHSRQLRCRPPGAEDWDAPRVRRVRRRILERASAERCGVTLAADEPQVEKATTLSVSLAVDEAARARCAASVTLAAAAGSGRELWDEECNEWVRLPDTMPTGRYVALQVSGDSMTPLIHAGDTILVRLGAEIEGGRIIVARRPDNGYVVKRVGRLNRRMIELVSLNPVYEPVLVPRSGRTVLGTVVMRWCAHGEPIHRVPQT